MTRRRQAERGFTLIELMIVMLIIAILCTMAAISLNPKVQAIDVAERVGDVMREANRRAVALGPVRADVAEYLGSKARTKVTAAGTTQPTFTLWRLDDSDPDKTNASWVLVSEYTVDDAVNADSWALGVNTKLALDPTNPDWSALSVKCYPDGTCDAVTMFFQSVKTEGSRDSRMSVLPIGGAILTRKDWN